MSSRPDALDQLRSGEIRINGNISAYHEVHVLASNVCVFPIMREGMRGVVYVRAWRGVLKIRALDTT
jgi:hypothetical protein